MTEDQCRHDLLIGTCFICHWDPVYLSIEAFEDCITIGTSAKDGSIAEVLISLAAARSGKINIGIQAFDSEEVNFFDTKPPSERALILKAIKQEEPNKLLPKAGRTDTSIKSSYVIAATHKQAKKIYKASKAPNEFDQQTRDQILEALLDSIIDHEGEPKSVQASESHRLAQEFNLTVYQIAGIRAAFTKEIYGIPEDLIQERKNERSL